VTGTPVRRIAVEERRARLSRWFGSVRVIPKFRTPLERALST
jgi:hypothetical protein